MFKKLDDSIFVSAQLMPEDVRTAALHGITMIINNRPDDEDNGQPTSKEIESLAKAVGVEYKAIPVTHAGFSTLQIDEMVIALSKAKGPVLAFCRSGTRSTLLWALAQAKLSVPAAELEAKAEAAGYSLAPIRAMCDDLGQSRNAHGEAALRLGPQRDRVCLIHVDKPFHTLWHPQKRGMKISATLFCLYFYSVP